MSEPLAAEIVRLREVVVRVQREKHELVADTERLNQMLRDHGYGQGSIDTYVAQCEDLDALRAENERLKGEVESRAEIAAITVAIMLAPTGAKWNLIPDGEGGLVLERRSGKFYERLEIAGDGTVRRVNFVGGKIVASLVPKETDRDA